MIFPIISQTFVEWWIFFFLDIFWFSHPNGFCFVLDFIFSGNFFDFLFLLIFFFFFILFFFDIDFIFFIFIFLFCIFFFVITFFFGFIFFWWFIFIITDFFFSCLFNLQLDFETDEFRVFLDQIFNSSFFQEFQIITFQL